MSYAKNFTGHKLLTHVDAYLQNHLQGRDADRWDRASMRYYQDDEGCGWERVEKNHPDNIRKCMDEAQVFLNDLNVTMDEVKEWV